MKKIFLSIALALCFAFPVAAQNSVTITPKKTTYTRKGRNIEEYKRTFTINYPVVSGALKPAVKTKLENTISYWRVYQTTLKESMTETWLESFDYAVNFNQNGILDLSLIGEGSAAYPTTNVVNLVVNLKTGAPVKLAEVLTPNAKLAQMVNKKLQTEKAEIIKSIDEDTEESAESKEYSKETVNALAFKVENFNEFRVTDKGITIIYDAGFPHVIQALQPAGTYFFTYAELKPFLKSNTIVSQFAR